jgi:hypothetical protein
LYTGLFLCAPNRYIILLRFISLLPSTLNYNHTDLELCTAYFVLTFPHPGLYWIYGNEDDDDDDEGL